MQTTLTGTLSLCKKYNMENNLIHGHDPLMNTALSDEIGDNDIFEAAVKDSVSSILRCYTGFFDIFSETIQNALDATEKKLKVTEGYTPKIWIDIDISNNKLRVVDNGCGMNLKEYKFCFRPSISFKKGQNLRGNKGVGATFLAYGYNFIKLQTKINNEKYSAILRQGREWVEDDNNIIPRPKFEYADFDAPELENESSGTCVEIKLTGNESEKPKNFWWFKSNTADQWLDILRIVTPLGAIYLNREKFNPKIFLKVTDKSGKSTDFESQKQIEYYYPHDIPNIKQMDLTSVRTEINSIEGDLKTRMNRLQAPFKNLEVLWDIWSCDQLLAADYLKLELTEEQIALMQKHEVSLYAAQVDSLNTWKAFNEQTGIRQNIKVMKGGIQLATDGMPQGDLIPIALKRNSGLQEYTLVIVHFKFGNPDTGRKSFQPELKELADELASKVTAYIINYRDLLRPDTGATKSLNPDKNRHEWIKRLESYRDTNPMRKGIGENFTYLSKAQEEQDVIAIFNQLIGMGKLKGIYFFSNNYNEMYDSLIELNYKNNSYLFSDENPLGVRQDIDLNDPYHPMVLEYKFDFDALLREFDTKDKFATHINFVVCWQASKKYKENVILKSLLIGKEGNARTIYGSTHQAFLPGKSDGPVFEVIILEELISYLTNKDTEIANQKVKYAIK